MDLSLQRGAIPVTLDRDRILFFDHNASWLLDQKFGPLYLAKLYRMRDKTHIEIVDPSVLPFFLFAGLQADAKSRGEEYTLEQAEAAIYPANYSDVAQRIVFAVVRATASPAMLGKATATGPAATPAARKRVTPTPGPTKVTTSMKRSASRTPASAGASKRSGVRRSGR